MLFHAAHTFPDNETLSKDTGLLGQKNRTDPLLISSINSAEISNLFDEPILPVVRIPKSEHRGHLSLHFKETPNVKLFPCISSKNALTDLS